MAKPYIFTTHRHRYSDDFWDLEAKMRSRFNYVDLSVHDSKFDGYVPEGELAETIENRISRCNLFIAIGRRATAMSDWCTWEIRLARKYTKPIACYSPYAMDPRLAPAVATAAGSYLGCFTQVRLLERWLDDLGLER
jgi:hypothetical protein